MFAPVPIAEKSSPSQVYELYNGGATCLKYEIDITPLQLLQVGDGCCVVVFSVTKKKYTINS